MVKGVTRRVVVVKPAPGDFFDEAIFLVKPSGGRSSDELLREACAIASRKAEHRLRRRSGRVLWFLLGVALGGALAGGVWMILALTR